MKEYCYACEMAHINTYETDSEMENEILEVPIKFFDSSLMVDIDKMGNLRLALYNPSDFIILSSKKIEYCPICGRKIEHPTPTERYENSLDLR